MQAYRFRLKIYLLILFSVMALGTIGFMIVEERSLLDALYYSIVTISTVGYGDIHPVSQTGKFLAVVLIITGVGTFLGVIANATEIMLSRREQKARIEKLNIVIGLFFSEIGMSLLREISNNDKNINKVLGTLQNLAEWKEEDIHIIKKELTSYISDLEPENETMVLLGKILKDNKYLLVQFLENPAVVEDELFTDILRASFHLYEELIQRNDLKSVSQEDILHLSGDVKRVYDLLILQWIDYMVYLKNNYPFLFSFAIRTNPFLAENIEI